MVIGQQDVRAVQWLRHCVHPVKVEWKVDLRKICATVRASVTGAAVRTTSEESGCKMQARQSSEIQIVCVVSYFSSRLVLLFFFAKHRGDFRKKRRNRLSL